jgi:hypothetical protein
VRYFRMTSGTSQVKLDLVLSPLLVPRDVRPIVAGSLLEVNGGLQHH